MDKRTEDQMLKEVLEIYMDEELKSYEKYENMPPHEFSEEYRRKMDALLKTPMEKKSPISKIFHRK